VEVTALQKCPNCQATLPDFAKSCQFCGTAFAQPPPPPGTRASKVGSAVNSLRWVKPAYYGIAGWWVLSGLLVVLEGLGVVGGGRLGVIDVLFGAVTALIGLGLILQVDAARGVVNVLCFLQILFGLFGLAMLFLNPFVGGTWGVIAAVMTFIQIGLAGLMIFLIGETETRGPNF
jgi:hypothetical protein